MPLTKKQLATAAAEVQPGTSSDFSRYWREYLYPLVGATICAAGTRRSEIGEEVAFLLVRTRAGQMVNVEAWRDDEGNGAGSLYLDPLN